MTNRTTLGGVTAAKTAEVAALGSSRMIGYCQLIDWANGLATVIVGQGKITVPMAGPTPPIPQRQCHIAFIGGDPVCIGVVPRSPTGTVSRAPSGGTLEVTTDNEGAKYTIAYDSTITFALNDRILVDWSSGGVAVAKLSADPISLTSLLPSAPPPPVITPGGEKSQTWNPYDAGTWSESFNKWQNSDVWCSDTTLGAWFYQGIADTIPDNAAILEIRVNVAAYQTQGSNPTIGVHSQGSKGGAPDVNSAVGVPGGSGWKALPTSFGDALKTGAARGLGTAHGGYHKWYGTAQNSGALFIKWRT